MKILIVIAASSVAVLVFMCDDAARLAYGEEVGARFIVRYDASFPAEGRVVVDSALSLACEATRVVDPTTLGVSKDLGWETRGTTNTSDWTMPYADDANTVALWHFDELSGRSVSDASGNGHIGKATNTRVISGQSGFGNCRSFADAPIGFIDFRAFQIPQTEGTFEAWVRPLTRPPTSCDHSHFFIKGLDGNSSSDFTFYIRIYNDGKIDAGTGESGGNLSVSTAPGAISYSGIWQHFAITWSSTGSHIYVNGNEVASGQAITVGQTRDKVALAKWGSSLYPDCRYLGQIDEVRISNVARTYTPGLVAYYPFSGNATDASGNGYHGTVVGATPINDRFGNSNSAYHFDGVDDEIVLGSAPFNFANQSFSISMWANWEKDPHSTTHIFDKQGYPLNGGGGYRLTTAETGELFFALSSDPFVEYFTGFFPTQGVWYYLVVTVDVSGDVNVYVNTDLKVSEPSGIIAGNDYDLKLGTRIDFGESRFGGVLDEVRIYDRVLSYNEILELYNETVNMALLDDLLSTTSPQGDIPTIYSLSQNYPNPFNPSTTIEFSLPQAVKATLKIYNTLGQEVATLLDDELQAGLYQRTWDASGMPSGIYFYRLQTGNLVETKKLILLK